MSDQAYLAVDLGASSGRVLAGSFDGQQVRLSEIHRFENGPVRVQGGAYWSFLELWRGVQKGLRTAAAQHGKSICSVGVDTWGVDYALLDERDELLGNPRHYRDPRTDGILDRAFQQVSREEIFSHTGLQFMPFNTLYQLLAARESGSPQLDAARSFLMMPDLFHWLLTGVKSNEMTNATTTQFYNPQTQDWARPLLQKFGIPTEFLGELMQPGATLGPLSKSVAEAVNLPGVQVVLPGTHDTASAVMAVPAQMPKSGPANWCYISSGTWSLMGVESQRPVVNDLCQRLNFTNEGGVGGTTRLLKNITGLWLLQECRRIWNLAGADYSWSDLSRMADEAAGLESFINPDDPVFADPADMPAAIAQFCRNSGQCEPASHGAIIRCALDSLALKCRQVLSWLEELTGSPLSTIHIVGGGTQNRQLCQATADACGRRVVAGPVEATALGNIMMQAIAAGAVSSIAQAREVIRRSIELEEYEPRDTTAWDEAFERYSHIS